MDNATHGGRQPDSRAAAGTRHHLRQGRRHLEPVLPGILEDAMSKLSGALRMLLAQLKLELDQLAARIDESDSAMEKASQENEACPRLILIPGIGPVTATALMAAIGNGAAFRKGREFSAWVGAGRTIPVSPDARVSCLIPAKPYGTTSR
jgi:transposase